MEASISEIQTITQYHYLGRGDFEPRIVIDDYVILLLQEGYMTRSEMARKTGVPRSTLYDALVKLIHKGEVDRFTKQPYKGRPKVYYILRKHAIKYKDNPLFIFF